MCSMTADASEAKKYSMLFLEPSGWNSASDVFSGRVIGDWTMEALPRNSLKIKYFYN